MIGFNYDAAGNLTKEGSSTPFWNYSWDAENRLSSISGSASDTFTYDGDGERVKRSYGALFWRQHGGPFLSKTNLSGSIVSERIYFNGLHVAIAHPPSGPVNYLFQDHLGGEHIVTDATGNLCQDIDTLPFGSEARFNTACDSSYRFAGMERDDEISSNVDYAGARYYDNRLGRFLSPDWAAHPEPVPYASIDNPQTLNLYSYVQNNPTSFVDPDGHCWKIVSWSEHVCNFFDGYGWHSNKQVEDILHTDTQWLRQHTSFDPEKMSEKQVIAVYNAAQSGKSSVSADGKKFVWEVVSVLSTLPGANPQWGKNRFVKELHDRGFVYEGPTNSGGGFKYRNPTTGEEVRLMPNPGRTPWRGDPAAKFENDWYYRYRSGPGQPEGPHTSLPNSD